MERDQACKEMHGYRELDRDMSGLVPRATNLGVADAIVTELFSTSRSQFRDFTPRDEFVPKDQNGALSAASRIKLLTELHLLSEPFSNPKVKR